MVIKKKYVLLCTIILITSTITSCGKSEQKVVNKPKAITVPINADYYVSNLIQNQNTLIKMLSTTDYFPLAGTDFSNTPVVNLPLASTILNEDNTLKKDVSISIDAYKATSLMDPSSPEIEAFAQLLTSRYDIETARKIASLSAEDKYIYNINVQGIGVIGNLSAAASSIEDEQGKEIYTDILIMEGYDKPVEVGLSLLSNIKNEELPSLPNFLKSNKFQTTSVSKTAVYWLFDSNLGSKKLMFKSSPNVLTDISTQENYIFSTSKNQSLSTQRKEGFSVNLDGKKGFLIKEDSNK